MFKGWYSNMRSAIKISSLLLAVVMLVSAIFVSGCSFAPEWSYKTSEKELAIGVYICALRSAYSKAETKAKELEDYDSSKDSWLDMEITDDDGNTEVARTWIKQKAEEQCLEYLVIENELKSTGATTDSAKMDEARAQAKTSWEVGQQTMYGQMPAAKTSLEKYGVSLDSYTYVVADAPQNEETLFDFLYSSEGPKAVADDELVKYVQDNYVDYAYISVPLYNSQQAEGEQQATSTAKSDEEKKKINDQINGYAKSINEGKSYDDVISEYMKESGLTESPSKDNIEFKDDFSAGEQIKAAYDKLTPGKAAVVTVGEDPNASVYLVYKKDIKSDAAKYVSENRDTVLHKAKEKDFEDYLKKLAENLDYEKSSAVDKYDPKMFFEPVETTKAAEQSSEDSDSSDAASGEESSAE